MVDIHASETVSTTKLREVIMVFEGESNADSAFK